MSFFFFFFFLLLARNPDSFLFWLQNLDRADPIMTEVEAFDIDLQMLKVSSMQSLLCFLDVTEN